MRFGHLYTHTAPEPQERLYPARLVAETPVPFPEELACGILLDDAFDSWPQTNRGLLVNGWNFSEGCRYTSKKPKGLFLFREEGHPGSYAERPIPLVTRSPLVFEWLYLCASLTLQEAAVRLLDSGRQTVVSVTHPTGTFMLGGIDTGIPVEEGQLHGLRLTLSPADNVATLQVDGRTAATVAIPPEAVAYFAYETGAVGIGYLQLAYLSAHTGYPVRERFFTGMDGTLPDDWQAEGALRLVELPYERNVDVLSLEMAAGGRITKTLPACPSSFSLSYSLFAEGEATLSATLSGENTAVCLALKEDAFSVTVDGNAAECPTAEEDPFSFTADGETYLYPYRRRVWFVVEWQYDAAAANWTLWINHKPVVTEPCQLVGSPTTLSLSCSAGTVLVDDITLMPLSPEPEDYVPAPVPADTGDRMLGMLTCDLWRAGNHLGWDRINGFEGGGRKPLLGWYEDGNVEAADWEIKFLADHGITFRMPCWYRSAYTIGQPFKTPLHSEALHNGYFHAKYSNAIKFAVFLTISPGEIAGYDDFVDNILPYLVEYYLKDPRYMTVDNQPLVGLYNYQALRNELGGEEQIAAAMERVREACRELGYDDARFITSLQALQTKDNAELARGSSDYACAYGWGILFAQSANGQYAVIQNTREYEGVKNLAASITTGFDFYPWECSNGSGTITPEKFATLCGYIRDRYLPSFPEGSPLSKLVMLDNWNEYSEGHALCPSEEYGFAWLDAIREAFASPAPHVDIRPTLRQQARMGLMYNPTRRLAHPDRYPAIPEAAECTRTLWEVSATVRETANIGGATYANRCGAVISTEDGWRISCGERQLFAVVDVVPTQPIADVPPYVEVTVKGDATGWDGRVIFAINGGDIGYVYQTRHMVPVDFDGTHTRFLCDIGRSVDKTGQKVTGPVTRLQLWLYPDGQDVLLTSVAAKDTS